jgi:hypothetical protein
MATSKKKGFMADSVRKAKLKFGTSTSTKPKAHAAKAKPAPARKKKTKAKGPKPPRPVGVSTPSPTATETEGTFTQYPVLASLPDLVNLHQTAHKDIKDALASVASITGPAEQVKKKAAGDIEALLVAADLDGTEDEGVTVGERRVKRIEVQGEEYVDTVMLLEAGVPIDTIKACTKRKEGYSYALVINPKKKGQTATVADAEEGEGHGHKKYA